MKFPPFWKKIKKKVLCFSTCNDSSGSKLSHSLLCFCFKHVEWRGVYLKGALGNWWCGDVVVLAGSTSKITLAAVGPKTRHSIIKKWLTHVNCYKWLQMDPLGDTLIYNGIERGLYKRLESLRNVNFDRGCPFMSTLTFQVFCPLSLSSSCCGAMLLQ